MCQKMPPKSAKLRNYSLSQQNSVKFSKDFTPDKFFFTPTLLVRWCVLASLSLCMVLYTIQYALQYTWIGTILYTVLYSTLYTVHCTVPYTVFYTDAIGAGLGGLIPEEHFSPCH